LLQYRQVLRTGLLFVIVAQFGCGRWHFESGATDGDASDFVTPFLPPDVQIVPGGFSTCAKRDGEVWCWGSGENGHTGQGSLVNVTAPLRVPGMNDVVDIEVNDGGVCARSLARGLFCWGHNGDGQFGLGNTNVQSSPVLIPVANVASYALAYKTACLVLGDGTVRCAGGGSTLGDGIGARRSSFGPVTNVADAILITGGDGHYCALLKRGNTKCWGDNEFGQLGNNELSGERNLAVDGPPGPFVQLAAGDAFTCGVLANQRVVQCWGKNRGGQLGTAASSGVDSGTPVTIAGLGNSQVVALAAASEVACAAMADGKVFCWGASIDGMLGPGVATSAIPVEIQITNVDAVFARTSPHICAAKKDKSVWCWGNNKDNQVSSVAAPLFNIPQQVVLP
jgi:alpha-tubulin suppressor-like RCC1 family protein